MEQQLAKITEEINQSLKNDDEWIKKAQLMKSMPGIGDATCALLIAEMPELGTLTDKQVTALLGVAPYTQESGTIRGRACIEGGRIRVRNAVYMAALTATRWNPKFKKIYDRLKNAGKKSKVALVAIMRRIIITLNIMLKRQESWNYSMAE